jgi:hypothetical protein
MHYRLNKISVGFYSFSVWDKDNNLIILHVGKEATVVNGAKSVGYDITDSFDEGASITDRFKGLKYRKTQRESL